VFDFNALPLLPAYKSLGKQIQPALLHPAAQRAYMLYHRRFGLFHPALFKSQHLQLPVYPL
jgi:hypothetical protein